MKEGQLTEAINNVFPLQTIKSLSIRWGIAKQSVHDRTKTKDFPKPLKGIVEGDERPLFSKHEIELYEEKKGLK